MARSTTTRASIRSSTPVRPNPPTLAASARRVPLASTPVVARLPARPSSPCAPTPRMPSATMVAGRCSVRQQPRLPPLMLHQQLYSLLSWRFGRCYAAQRHHVKRPFSAPILLLYLLSTETRPHCADFICGLSPCWGSTFLQHNNLELIAVNKLTSQCNHRK